MIKELKIKGHIIDSLVLSKLLDQINELGLTCYATKVDIGKRREDISEATFIIEADNNDEMLKAVELAKKQGAYEE